MEESAAKELQKDDISCQRGGFHGSPLDSPLEDIWYRNLDSNTQGQFKREGEG